MFQVCNCTALKALNLLDTKRKTIDNKIPNVFYTLWLIYIQQAILMKVVENALQIFFIIQIFKLNYFTRHSWQSIVVLVL